MPDVFQHHRKDREVSVGAEVTLKSGLSRGRDHVCFTPHNGHWLAVLECPLVPIADIVCGISVNKKPPGLATPEGFPATN